MENVIFEFYKGDTYEKNIVIKKYKSEINQIYFSVKSKESDKRTVLQKKLNDGIILVDSSDDERTYQVLINSTDTDNLKIGEYYFDIEIVTDKQPIPIKRTIVKGILKLKAEITSSNNERGV